VRPRRRGSRVRGERRESATDVRLDGDEMPADADDGDAGHFSRTYMAADPAAIIRLRLAVGAQRTFSG
jgi:hypothetical protein